jgi:hypothetical protein
MQIYKLLANENRLIRLFKFNKNQNNYPLNAKIY